MTSYYRAVSTPDIDPGSGFPRACVGMNEDCQISMKDLSTSAKNSLIVFRVHDLLRNTS